MGRFVELLKVPTRFKVRPALTVRAGLAKAKLLVGRTHS